jgi:chromosome segregation ATPase
VARGGARRARGRARRGGHRGRGAPRPDPGIQGDSIGDLDDAAAVVARLRSALERIEELERSTAGFPRGDAPALADVEDRTATGRHGLAGRPQGLEEVRQELRAEIEGLREERKHEAAAADIKLEELRFALDEIRRDGEETRGCARDAGADLIALRQESSKILEAVAMSRQQAQAAMQRAHAAEQRVESLSSQLHHALAALDELKARSTPAGEAAGIACREAERAERVHEGGLASVRERTAHGASDGSARHNDVGARATSRLDKP